MKITSVFQVFDLLVQTALMMLIGFSLTLGLTLDRTALTMGLVCLFPLGLWQLFSALLLGLVRGDRYRLIYLITAVAFCGLFISVLAATERLNIELPRMIYGIVFYTGLFISFFAGLAYFLYSYRFHFLGGK